LPGQGANQGLFIEITQPHERDAEGAAVLPLIAERCAELRLVDRSRRY
jgi:hypothetical protein